MADNKKYYYIRLKENFFDSNEIVLLESMQDGYLYSNILLKLYLRSLSSGGKLLFNDRIPYNPQMLATITRHNVGTVEKALQIFQEMGLVEILDNGAIYMMDIQAFIGESSSEADRKRSYRARVEADRTIVGQIKGQIEDKCPDKSTPEYRDYNIEIKERKINKKKEKDIRPCADAHNNKKFVKPSLDEITAYCAEKSLAVNASQFIDYYEANGWRVGRNPMKDWKAAVRTWARRGDFSSKPQKSKSKATYDLAAYENADLEDFL